MNGSASVRHLTKLVHADERGQVFIIFTAVITVIMAAAVIGIDYSMWLSERRGIARAADLAALAAIRDLPADPVVDTVYTEGACDTDACTAVYDWAGRNGYGELDNADVRVAYFCSNTIAFPPDGFCKNEQRSDPVLPISPCPSEAGEVGCDSVRVSIQKEAVNLFGAFFGGINFDVGYTSFARVSFRIAPLDTVMSIDASGSMDNGCSPAQDNVGCPIREARKAANDFVTILLGDDPDEGNVQVGYAPYRACYNPPSGAGSCVPSLGIDATDCGNPPSSSWVLCLGKDPDLLRNRFAATMPGSSTNVCLGMFESGEILAGPGMNQNPEAQRFLVLLTDGENYYPVDPDAQAELQLPPDCIPNNQNSNNNFDCDDAPSPAERGLDTKTMEMADDLKAQGVEIYVVGLNVCDIEDGTIWDVNPGFCNAIGNGQDDDVANRRLLKCIASSNPGTNDHYNEANAIDLGDIFQGVAYEIAGRGLSTEPP